MSIKILFIALICIKIILFKITYEEHIPYSNNASLIGHINFIIPISNLINNYILLSSFNGNVALLNYKTGKPQYVKTHKEDEKIKKLYGNEKYAIALIYKNNLEKDINGIFINDENIYSYINVYNIVNSYLLSVFEYKNEIIEDFLIKDEQIVILFNNRIDIGNIIDNSIYSIYFKELNLNSIYLKVILLEDNIVTLFYVDKDLYCYIISIDKLNKNIINLNKIEELRLNNKINYYVSVYNKNVVIIYNKKYLYWIELTNEEKKYYYNYMIINNNDEENIFKNEIIENNKFIKGDEMEQWYTSNYIVIDVGEYKLIYNYFDKKMNFIKKVTNGEIVGYYVNKYNKKEMIFAKDENNKIIIKSTNEMENEKALNILNKSNNIYYNGEIIVGIYNSEEEKNYYFSVYNDSSFTVYKENNVFYSREESLAYIDQLYFYNFQHLRKNSIKHSYNIQLQILNDLKKYIKNKITSFNKPFIEEIVKKKEDSSLFPFNFFYLSIEEKMNLLNICNKKKLKSDVLINSKKETNIYDKKNTDYKFTMMNSMLEDSFTRFSLHHSSKYAGSSVILVSTCNNIIFAFHLFTGLILYKIDGNKFQGRGMFSLKKHLCSFSMSKNNWSEIENGKKLIFINNNNNNNDSNIILNSKNELHVFKKFSKESVITIFKSDKSSYILIFDILYGDIIFEKKIDSFLIQNYFVLKKSSSIIAIDNLLNIKIVNVFNNEIDEDINEKHLFFYNINISQNYIEGYRLINSSQKKNDQNKLSLIKTYSININDEKLELFAKSITKKNIFFPIKINKDASISYKYINDNIISYITRIKSKENIIYTLYVVDGISGSLIYSKILDKYSKPPFHVVINENYVILNYFNENLNKYIFHIIEILLDKSDPGFLSIITSKKEKFVDLFDEQKIVINEKNYIIDHNVKSFNFTETKRGITNKHLLLLLDTNKISSLNITDDQIKNHYKYFNQFITHTDILYNAKGFIANESLLESTTLLFSWGNYLYFTYYQPNGSFDTIENFNFLLLLFLIILVFIGTYLSYVKRVNKKLYIEWS
ncbi:ER membrane protein complex subunit 1, putative [Plasmodium gallinaceum]|uniref:ER membrane protein complex subunit 1 n=1 Tax=Plasmodium gallinaceum TaxID=5849 RepID=A0A1J1GZM9_PLAGA|nr:ER membrane protein complex subunit 1, putative [Plasmodium gallinaceum]CRG97673.1 ER membrane protein complex subunit 1, putative [Plasmodium gallinaceum]